LSKARLTIQERQGAYGAILQQIGKSPAAIEIRAASAPFKPLQNRSMLKPNTVWRKQLLFRE